MIKFVRVEKVTDLKFAGVSIEDISEKSITFKTDNNEIFRVENDGYSSIRLLVPARPKMVEKFKIEGDFNGLSITELFESKYDADNKINSFPYDIRENFKVKTVEVKETENV